MMIAQLGTTVANDLGLADCRLISIGLPVLLAHAPDPPADQRSGGNNSDGQPGVVVHDAAKESDNLRAKTNHQYRKNAEAQEAAEEDGSKKVGEAHLGNAGGENEQLEGSRRRQHRG